MTPAKTPKVWMQLGIEQIKRSINQKQQTFARGADSINSIRGQARSSTQG